MSQCPNVDKSTNPDCHPLLRSIGCQLEADHTGEHRNGTFYWPNTAEPVDVPAISRHFQTLM